VGDTFYDVFSCQLALFLVCEHLSCTYNGIH
jgi:hypothetical protein